MVEQTKVTQILSDRLRNQMHGVQTAAERNLLLKNIVNSERGSNQIDHVNPDRLHEKLEGVKKNPVIMDLVHISPEAKALYHAQTSPTGNHPDRSAANPLENEQTSKPELTTEPEFSET